MNASTSAIHPQYAPGLPSKLHNAQDVAKHLLGIRYPPPYQSMEDQWNDQSRQWLRSVRKLVFLPASPDVGTLSTLTRSLVDIATSNSPATVASVVISYPALPGLYAEDISDVGHHLSLPLLKGNHVYPPRSIVSAYAGYGMGLCTSYNDEAQCRKEGLILPVRPTLFIEYTSTAVLLHLASMREAYDLADPDVYTYPYFFRPGDPSTPDSEKRLRQLRVCIIMLLHRCYTIMDPPKLITVLLTGESATSAAAEAVDRAVKSAGFQIELFGPTYPEFTIARGASELAWRAFSLNWSEQMET
ncbi:hypothetical protein HRS9122_02756 [Pyrenophora teres f. teres]|nr:hypothetical protein HRS9122_02756 [Pyrenophora teres f. teres]